MWVCYFLVCQLAALQYISEAAVVLNGVGSLGHCPAGPTTDRQIQNLFSLLSFTFFFFLLSLNSLNGRLKNNPVHS